MPSILIAGVDEVGRGPLAGPVVAAAVILDPEKPIEGLVDSKKISEKKREKLCEQIKADALAWSVAEASVAEIDELNILHASLLAMKRAVNALDIKPARVEVDGHITPNLSIPCEAIVKGDSTVPVISAASIVAKVTRDRLMVSLAESYPGYGFDKHKGYPTKAHIAALNKLGLAPIHRLSFGPCQKVAELEVIA